MQFNLERVSTLYPGWKQAENHREGLRATVECVPITEGGGPWWVPVPIAMPRQCLTPSHLAQKLSLCSHRLSRQFL